MVIVNSPHNPSGKIFTYEEIREILSLLNKDVVVVFDESHAEISFDPHTPFRIPRLHII